MDSSLFFSFVYHWIGSIAMYEFAATSLSAFFLFLVDCCYCYFSPNYILMKVWHFDVWRNQNLDWSVFGTIVRHWISLDCQIIISDAEYRNIWFRNIPQSKVRLWSRKLKWNFDSEKPIRWGFYVPYGLQQLFLFERSDYILKMKQKSEWRIVYKKWKTLEERNHVHYDNKWSLHF